jgi:sporulation protein YlmC with PRC-barrel domain
MYSSARALVASLAVVVAGPALAQQDQAQDQRQVGNQPATQCLADLRAFNQTLSNDRFWVTGWGRSWGYGVGATAPMADGTASQQDNLAAAPGMAPWGGTGVQTRGVQSPRFQIRSLYEAAFVLGQQGSQEGCAFLLAQLNQTYDSYVSRLEQSGVNPDEVGSWRQEQLALGRPVSQMETMGRFTVDDLTGTDVRNLEDEYLGSISDVAFDARSGSITYVIVARGGFLGIGENHVAVPWDIFRATPGLNTLILDVSENTLEQAPNVDPDTFADSSAMSSQDEQVNSYWEQQT